MLEGRAGGVKPRGRRSRAGSCDVGKREGWDRFMRVGGWGDGMRDGGVHWDGIVLVF